MDLLLIVAIPFVIALALALPFTKQVLNKTLLTWGLPAVLLLLAGMMLWRFPEIQSNGAVAPPPIEWMPHLGITFSFYLDGLSLLFGLVVTVVGAMIFFYMGWYFEDYEKQRRFTVWMSAFTGAMLGVVLAGNLLLMFIMWELTSITSFMLIGFYGDKDEEARVSARRALVITGAGGLALLAGVLLIGGAVGQTLAAGSDPALTAAVGEALAEETVEGDIDIKTENNGSSTTFVAGDENNIPFRFEFTDMLAIDTLAVHPWYVVIAVLVMLGAFTKSAQFPFHFWLPGAMTAPTPASAFLHSATMVKAGIYLLARLHPIMYQDPIWVNGLLTFGMITMLISAVFALQQRDLKGLLAYSTTSWLGTLVTLIALPGFNGFKALAIGILAHALYKSALFLSVGSIDHSVGTRVLDKLGGMWHYMRGTAIVVIISALSMAGIPVLFGFVAKEVLLDAANSYMTATYMGSAAMVIVFVSAALNGTAAYILIWEVFFGKPRSEIHYHAMPNLTVVGPMILAVGGTIMLPLLLEVLINPLVATVTPKEFELYLIPAGGFANPIFQISLGAIVVGFAVFLLRKPLVSNWKVLPFTGAQGYQAVIDGIDYLADVLVRSQNGRIRYYLFYILGVVAAVLLTSSLLPTLIRSDLSQLANVGFTTGSFVDFVLLIVAISAVLFSVIVKRHLIAALAIGVFGYAVGGIMIVEDAPDVALVQFLVETLATVLIIVMISRISHRHRKKAADELWTSSRAGVWRDALIASVIGFSVFVFALTAVVNRPERTTIGQWHIENAELEIGVTDVVAAIVTDFRAMDTLIEIGVFAISALGILSLLALNREEAGVDTLPARGSVQRVQQIAVATPLTRVAVFTIFPLALLLAMVQMLYGGFAPGDGFTSGVIGGLALALGYVVFGYYQMKDRISWLHPLQFVSVGLAIGVINAALPMLFGGNWLGHLSAKWFDFAGLKLATTIVFELSIALTVFGSVGIILEAIAHPRDVEMLAGDETYDPSYEPPPASAQMPETAPQPGMD